jgi:hypothetical protein
MAEDGMVSLIFKVDSASKALVGNIQIESRGFVYSNEVRTVHTKVVNFAKSKYNTLHKKGKEVRDILRAIKDDLGEFIDKEIGREPMVITSYVYIADGAAQEAKLAAAKAGPKKVVRSSAETRKSAKPTKSTKSAPVKAPVKAEKSEEIETKKEAPKKPAAKTVKKPVAKKAPVKKVVSEDKEVSAEDAE